MPLPVLIKPPIPDNAPDNAMLCATAPASAAWKVMLPFTLVSVMGKDEDQSAVAPIVPPESVRVLVNVPVPTLFIPPEPIKRVPPVIARLALPPVEMPPVVPPILFETAVT